MAIYCEACVNTGGCCDFCLHHTSQLDEDGCQTGPGWCHRHGKHVEFDDCCDRYHCAIAAREPPPLKPS
ncbi:MAG: hypothetical protein NTW01_09975 [Gammaproteobacteria bacterium]|nr:hypothetical protein [Gammaproteobacteria bacterium]